MKRRFLAGLLAAVLILNMLPGLPAQALSAPQPSGGALPESGNRETLSVLDYEVTIDEASDTVKTRLILENSGREAVSLDYQLPLISAGAAPGTLELLASGEARRTSEKTVWFSAKPQALLVFSYTYKTASPLIHAGAIGMDFKQLLFREGGRIGHFSVSLTLREEDLPLVEEISPVNYRINGCEISLELIDFSPSVLLNRFYLTKETYRNLKGSRDHEPNEEQQAVLENYRKWFREGIPLRGMGKGGAARIFANMIGAEITPGPAYLQPYMAHYSRLKEGNRAYQWIVDYLILRELTGMEAKADQYAMMSFINVGLVCRELLRKGLYGDNCYVVVMGMYAEPSLCGVPLFRGHTVGSEEQFEWTPVTEMDLLFAEPYGMYSIKNIDEYLRFRTSAIRHCEQISSEILSAYLRTLGADLFVKQMLLDNRQNEYSPERWGIDWINAVFACPETGNIRVDDLKTAHSAMSTEYERPLVVLEQDDDLLSSLPCPAFTHYTGWIREKDGEAHYEPFESAGYLSYPEGLPFYAQIADSPKALAVRENMKAQAELLKREINSRIQTAGTGTLTETPFHETGDRTRLSVLALDMEVVEESDRVTARLLLENTGTEAVTACVPLPILRNGAAEDSVKVVNNSRESGVKADPISGNRILLTIAGGAVLDLSVRYLAASRLIHAGAIALDLEPFVFSEGGRIGRFSIAVTLREEDIPLVTEISPVNYRLEEQTVSVTLYDFAPNRLLSRFILTKNTYRDLMGSRDYEPSEGELYVLENYRRWFREGFPLPDGQPRILLDLAEIVAGGINPDGSHPERIMNPGGRPLILYKVLMHLCLKALVEKNRITKAQAIDFLENSMETQWCAPLTLDLLRERFSAQAPVLVAVEYAGEESLAGTSLFMEEWKEKQQGEETVIVREIIPVDEQQLIRARRTLMPGQFRYEQENMRVLKLSDSSDLPADVLQDTLDVLGISLYIRAKLMDNRDGAYGKVTYFMPAISEREIYRQAYFSTPEGGVLSPEALQEALLSEAFFRRWYDETFFTILETADPGLAALSIPAFTQYAGIVETEEGKAMVRMMEICSNPLYSECGLHNYRAILQTEAAAAALAAQQARRNERINHVIQKIESVTQ